MQKAEHVRRTHPAGSKAAVFYGSKSAIKVGERGRKLGKSGRRVERSVRAVGRVLGCRRDAGESRCGLARPFEPSATFRPLSLVVAVSIRRDSAYAELSRSATGSPTLSLPRLRPQGVAVVVVVVVGALTMVVLLAVAAGRASPMGTLAP